MAIKPMRWSEEKLEALALEFSVQKLKPSRPVRVSNGGLSVEYAMYDGKAFVSVEMDSVVIDREPWIRLLLHSNANYLPPEAAQAFYELYGRVLVLAEVCWLSVDQRYG